MAPRPRPGGGGGPWPDRGGVQEGHEEAQEAGVQPTQPPEKDLEARPLQQQDQQRRRRRSRGGEGGRQGLHRLPGDVRGQRTRPGDAVRPYVPQRLLGAVGEEPWQVPGVQVCVVRAEGEPTGPNQRRWLQRQPCPKRRQGFV